MVPRSLSVVVPVYNDPYWLERIVDDLDEAIRRSPYDDGSTEIIIVDDGSDDATREAIRRLAPSTPVRVIHQANAGRFEARRTGLRQARNELVLLIDSRVSIAPNALSFVAGRVQEDPTATVWNAHVEIELDGNPYARFWNTLTEVAFREYFGNPRTTSFGLEDFDRFPKGTTCFLAPRSVLLDAVERFSSAFADLRDANDDTIIIRSIAANQRVNISPEFRCLYRSRDALGPFLRHAFHRGGVFVDGYRNPSSRFFPLLAGFLPASAIAVAVALRHPWRTLATALTLVPILALAFGLMFRRPPRDIANLALVGPPWLLSYGAGVWRGVALAVSAATRRAT